MKVNVYIVKYNLEHCGVALHLATRVYEDTAQATANTHSKKFFALLSESYPSAAADKGNNATSDGHDTGLADHGAEAGEAGEAHWAKTNKPGPLLPSDNSDPHHLEQELWHDHRSEIRLQPSEQLIGNKVQETPGAALLTSQDAHELWYDCHGEDMSQLPRPTLVSSTGEVSTALSSARAICDSDIGGETVPLQLSAGGTETDTLTESDLGIPQCAQQVTFSDGSGGGTEGCDVWYDCFTDLTINVPDLINEGVNKLGFTIGGPDDDDDDDDMWYDCLVGHTQSQAGSFLNPSPSPPYSSHSPSHDPFKNRNRFENMTDKVLSDQLVNLLSKGPNFALSRSVNKTILKEVEIGLERGAFALRWKEHIDKKQKGSQSQSVCCEPQSSVITPSTNQPETNDPVPDPDSDQAAHRSVRLTPRFSDTDTRAAPTGHAVTERTLKTLKHKVMTIYKNHRSTTEPNHTLSDVKRLKELGNDPDIIVKRSDKCKGLVILSKSDYIQKAEKITDDYEIVTANPTPKLEAKTKMLIKTTLANKVPDKIVKSVLPTGSRTAELYGLPKTHKPDAPLRPIVSACGDPLDKLTWLLERIITQLLAFVPAHLTNTDDYLHRLRTQFPHGLPAGAIVFSVDVTNLYGNIPTSEAITATLELIKKHLDKIDTFGLSELKISKRSYSIV